MVHQGPHRSEPLLVRPLTRPEELAAIDSWIEAHGMIPYPARYAAGVLDHLPGYVIARRLAELELPPASSYQWLRQLLTARNPPA
jgi:hypothetical protein